MLSMTTPPTAASRMITRSSPVVSVPSVLPPLERSASISASSCCSEVRIRQVSVEMRSRTTRPTRWLASIAERSVPGWSVAKTASSSSRSIERRNCGSVGATAPAAAACVCWRSAAKSGPSSPSRARSMSGCSARRALTVRASRAMASARSE